MSMEGFYPKSQEPIILEALKTLGANSTTADLKEALIDLRPSGDWDKYTLCTHGDE